MGRGKKAKKAKKAKADEERLKQEMLQILAEKKALGGTTIYDIKDTARTLANNRYQWFSALEEEIRMTPSIPPQSTVLPEVTDKPKPKVSDDATSAEWEIIPEENSETTPPKAPVTQATSSCTIS